MLAVALLFQMYLFGKVFLCYGPTATAVLRLLLGQGKAGRAIVVAGKGVPVAGRDVAAGGRNVAVGGRDIAAAGRGLCCHLALAQVPFSPQDDYLHALCTQLQGVFQAGFHSLPVCGNCRTTE